MARISALAPPGVFQQRLANVEQRCSEFSAEPGFVLSGPPRSGKSSLALQVAVCIAAEDGPSVILLSEAKFAAKPPRPFTCLEELPEDVLNRIECHYVTSLHDCRVFCSSPTGIYRMMDALPRVIIVDDDGFDEAASAAERAMDVAETLAVLGNTVDWIRGRSPESRCFFVYVSNGCVANVSAWPGAAPAAFPLNRALLHARTRAEAADDGAPLWSCTVHYTAAMASGRDSDVAVMYYRFPSTDQSAPMLLQ